MGDESLLSHLLLLRQIILF